MVLLEQKVHHQLPVATGWEVQAHFAGDSSHVASNVNAKIYNTVKHNVTLGVSAGKECAMVKLNNI